MVPPAATSPRLASPLALLELAEIAAAPLRYGHGIRVLRDGALAFPAMLAGIRAARRSVCFENFIMADDQTGRDFAAALRKGGERGAKVRVLYDPVGSLLVRGGPVGRLLRRAGIEARAFRPLSPLAPWSWLRLRHRDHRKLLVCDDLIAFVGGICISDHWAPSDLGGAGWRDTAVSIRGPAVLDLQLAFDRMWSRARGEPPPTPLSRRPPPEKGEAAVVVVGDRPGLGRVAAIYEWLADRAEESIELTDAYFVAPRSVLEAFIRAARRGVRVRLLVPGRNNHPVAGLAARRIYQPLLDAGAEIYEWSGVMLHAKTAVVDSLVALVGSSNLDPLSLRRNFEMNALIADPETGRAMSDLFGSDLQNAVRVESAEWRRRPLRARAAESAATLFADML
ncbi:MAG TPA: phospholipase D-like domain-containing protein [Gemmatimonadales bacterium]|nr:phospholipase D-like domain-containing protein [Gemmatimonadales bacterium]